MTHLTARPHAPRPGAARQRGMVTAVVVLFMIATVIFVLVQMLGVSSSNIADSHRQDDSTAAFFLAESGLERAQTALAAAYTGNATNAACTGVTTGAPYALGRGTVSFTAVSTPPTCTSGGAPLCTACTVTAVGKVGVSTREVTRELLLTVQNGVTCLGSNGCGNNPVTWQLSLRNTSGVAGIAIFNLAYDGQGNNRATCAVGSNCRLQIDLNSPAAGNDSSGLMGNAVLIPGNTTYPIYQTMTQGSNSLAEVGAFFLGTTAPTLTGPTAAEGAASYWDNRQSQAGANTVGAGTSTGATNDGTATSSGTCDTPGAGSNSRQQCTSWCYGGDTLVYSFASTATLLTDELASVTFGTNSGVGQQVPMVKVAKYPSTLVPNAPTNVDAEIWYASNPNFTGSSPLALNASSYKGRGSGSIGARWTSNNTDTTAIATAAGLATLTVGNSFNAASAYPNQIISVGDTVTHTGGGGSPTCNTNCGTIVSQLTSGEASGALGGRGTYRLSVVNTVAAANNRQWTINSNVLHITACTTCFFANGDALTGLISGRTLGAQTGLANTYGFTEATGGVGRYAFSGTATYVALGTNLSAGTPGPTLYLPSTSSQPVASTPAMRIIVKTGTGTLPVNTLVTGVSAPNAATTAFTISTTPGTPLDGATLCGGTCAFFVPTSGATTTFSMAMNTTNMPRWASGFTCLKGVNLPVQVVTSSSVGRGRWLEAVK